MMDAKYFNPYIVYMHSGAVPAGHELSERMCLWYELELITGGDEGAGVVILDKFIPALPGTLFLRRPGDLVRSVAPFSFASILFDVVYNPALEPYYAYREASLMSGVDIEFLRKYHADGDRKFSFLERIPRVMRVGQHERLLKSIMEITDLARTPDESFQFYAKTLLMNLLLHISCEDRSDQPLFSHYPPAVQQALGFIETNYMNSMTLEEIAAHVSLSREYFCRLFRQHTGQTPMSYLQRMRIHNAKLMLLGEDISVEEVATRCGFRALSYFYAVFKKHTGQSPWQYQLRHFATMRIEGGDAL